MRTDVHGMIDIYGFYQENVGGIMRDIYGIYQENVRSIMKQK
jgi:hypothetical protein